MQLRHSICSATPCVLCSAFIPFGSLYIDQADSRPCHLSCFIPPNNDAISFESFSFDIAFQSDIEELSVKIQTWNEQFFVTEDDIPPRYLCKRVASKSTPVNRLLIETFRFLSARDIEQGAAFVCKGWFHASRDEETWQARLALDYPPACGAEPRKKYIVCVRNSCWNCNVLQTPMSIAGRYQLGERVTCLRCSKSAGCVVVNAIEYLDFKLAECTLLDRLQIPFFEYGTAISSYEKLIVDKLRPYVRERNRIIKEALLSDYSAEIPPHRLRDIDAIDVDVVMYGGKLESSQQNEIYFQLWKFCVADDRREDRRKKVEAVARVLTRKWRKVTFRYASAGREKAVSINGYELQ